MRWLLTGLCAIAVTTSPAAASADVASEAVSTKPVVIAYIPEHLQHRVPGHQHEHQASAPTSEGMVQTDWEELYRQERNRRIGVAIGVSLAVVAIGVGVGVGVWKAFENSFEWGQ